MTDEAQHSFEHTKERLKSRYALDIEYAEYVELCAQCALRENVVPIPVKGLPSSSGQNYTVYRVEFKNRYILVLFEEFKMLIKTVLPPQ